MRWSLNVLIAELQRYRARAEVLEREGYFDLARDLNALAEKILDRIARIRLGSLDPLSFTPVV